MRRLGPAASAMSELLTDNELTLIEKLGECANLFAQVIGDGEQSINDLYECVDKIHQLQHMVMSQAAARAYPEKFRLLGGTVSE